MPRHARAILVQFHTNSPKSSGFQRCVKDSTSYPTFLWLYSQEQCSSSIKKKFLAQWHSPVKKNTPEQKWVSSTSKARLVHTAGTKVFYLFLHLKLGISYFFFQSLYFLCQSLFNDKTRQGLDNGNTKKGHKKWMLQIDHSRMPGSNKQMWSWHRHRKEGRDCTEIPEQSSPCLLLWGFQLVAVLPLILFFHLSRGSLKKGRETTSAGWKKNVLLEQTHKIWFCYHITSHHQPQGSTLGPGRRNKLWRIRLGLVQN